MFGAGVLSWSRAFELYELQTYDWRCRLRGDRPVCDRIALIEIGDDSLQKIGQWPFSRDFHGALIDALRYADAVIFDVIFVEPTENDEYMAAMTQDAGNVYYSIVFDTPVRKPGRYETTGTIGPLLPSLAENARDIGFVNALPDPDGKRRRVIPFLIYDKHAFLATGLGPLPSLLGFDKHRVRLTASSLELSDDWTIPLVDGAMMVTYAGPWERTFRHYSYVDVIKQYTKDKRAFVKEFSGKICFVGFTATASHDANATPLEPVYPNVGMHANILNSVLQRDFIRRPDRWLNLSILALLSALILWICQSRRPLAALRQSLVALLGFSAIVIFVFCRFGIWLDFFYPLVVGVGVFSGTLALRALREMRKREFIESELKIAAQIQRSFLPSDAPKLEGLEVAVHMQPAKTIGGDLYAFVPLGEGRLGIMIGDVSGKGTPAALFMAKAVSEFKIYAPGKARPSEALAAFNRSIAAESTGGLFVTLTYAIFDLGRRTVLLASGGHLPTVRVGSTGACEQLVPPDGMPVGISDEVVFSDCERSLEAGDCYAFFSDGVTEARNRKEAEYGLEALERKITDDRARSASEIVKSCVAHIAHFSARAEQHDDLTLIVAKISK